MGLGKFVVPKTTTAPKGRTAWSTRSPGWDVALGPPKSFLRTVKKMADNPDMDNWAIKSAGAYLKAQQNAGVQTPRNPGSGGGGGGGGGGYGGGGGPDPAIAAQAQLDYMMKLLAGTNWKAQPLSGGRATLQSQRDALGQLRSGVDAASVADQATGTAAWDAYERWLASNQSNPYDNLQFQQAQVAQDQNALLTSQGAAAQPMETRNPNDGYAGSTTPGRWARRTTGRVHVTRGEGQAGRANTTTGISCARQRVAGQHRPTGGRPLRPGGGDRRRQTPTSSRCSTPRSADR